MKDDKIYIEHILQSIDRIGAYLSGKDHQSFSDDFMTQDGKNASIDQPSPVQTDHLN